MKQGSLIVNCQFGEPQEILLLLDVTYILHDHGNFNIKEIKLNNSNLEFQIIWPPLSLVR